MRVHQLGGNADPRTATCLQEPPLPSNLGEPKTAPKSKVHFKWKTPEPRLRQGAVSRKPEQGALRKEQGH